MCPLACRDRRIWDYERYPKHVRALELAVDAFLEMHPNTTLTEWGGADMISSIDGFTTRQWNLPKDRVCPIMWRK